VLSGTTVLLIGVVVRLIAIRATAATPTQD
jgi:hypothetical protein